MAQLMVQPRTILHLLFKIRAKTEELNLLIGRISKEREPFLKEIRERIFGVITARKKGTYQRRVGSYMENRVLGNEDIALHLIKRIILAVSQNYLILKNASAGANSNFGSAQYQVQGLHLIMKF